MANLNEEVCRTENSISTMAEESSYQMESSAKKADHIEKGCKRCNCNLVAEESNYNDSDLEDNNKKKKTRKDHGNTGRSFFDCNICLDMAREPVVTLCGHLFCWICFYRVRYVNQTAKSKECPVCRGEVSDSSIIPIYGGGGIESSIEDSELVPGSGIFIPPRPRGQRTDRVYDDPVAGVALRRVARVGGIHYRDLPEILRGLDWARRQEIYPLVDRSTFPNFFP